MLGLRGTRRRDARLFESFCVIILELISDGRDLLSKELVAQIPTSLKGALPKIRKIFITGYGTPQRCLLIVQQMKEWIAAQLQ